MDFSRLILALFLIALSIIAQAAAYFEDGQMRAAFPPALMAKRLRGEPIRFGKRAPREPIRFGKRGVGAAPFYGFYPYDFY